MAETTTETAPDSSRLSPELSRDQVIALEKRGQTIFQLRGTEGNRTGIKTKTPLKGMIAVDTEHFLLKDSGRRTFAEQKKLAEAYVTEVAEQIPGLKGVIFSPSALMELSKRYMETQYGVEPLDKKPLMSERHFAQYTRVVSEDGVINMGQFSGEGDYVLDSVVGPDRDVVGPNDRSKHVFLAVGLVSANLKVPAELEIQPKAK